MMDLPRLCAQVADVVGGVSAFICAEQKTFMRSAARQKGDAPHDLVSYVDLEAERRLIEGLGPLVHGAGFIAEENHQAYKQGLNWIIDPLDGTTNFIQGLPFHAVSVALAHDSDLLLGVVADNMHGDIYHTWQGGPALCKGQAIGVSTNRSLDTSLVATGFSVKDHAQLDQNLEVLKKWVGRTRGVRRLGAAALDLCLVARGSFDLYYETNLSAWDVAAGALLVANAGGRVSTFGGGNDFLFGNEILATNTHLHPAAMEVLLG
ncbi:MAG: inositol monophosphatase [Bacteroidetes bacterium]|jgi:myo-inositol-1(or 4)-monophosphatase|nr:inositol monophosphatase [Bacteroidota bacterium]